MGKALLEEQQEVEANGKNSSRIQALIPWNQVLIRSAHVPRNTAEAYKLNQANDNSLWTEAIDREVKLLRDGF